MNKKITGRDVIVFLLGFACAVVIGLGVVIFLTSPMGVQMMQPFFAPASTIAPAEPTDIIASLVPSASPSRTPTKTAAPARTTVSSTPTRTPAGPTSTPTGTAKILTEDTCFGTDQGAYYYIEGYQYEETCTEKMTSFKSEVDTFSVNILGHDLNFTVNREGGSGTYVISGSAVKSVSVTLTGTPKNDEKKQPIGSGTITSSKAIDTVDNIQETSVLEFTAEIVLWNDSTIILSGYSWYK